MNIKKIIFCLIAFFISYWLADSQGNIDLSARCFADSSPVVAHTSGAISGSGNIRVRFAREIVSPGRLQKTLEESPFAFKPDIKGTAHWIDTRTLEFQPANRLPAGRKYQAAVDLSQIMEIIGVSQTFRFEFSVLKQAFEITIDGLQAATAEDPKNQEITGVIVTADIEEAAALEKILNVYRRGKKLGVRWHHSNDQREHRFVVPDIMREEDDVPLMLQWDGRPIGVSKKGKRVISVPSLKTFDVIFARAVQTEENYIEIRFTDPLQKSQDLQGLVAVDDNEDLQFDIEGSILRLYGSVFWSNEVTVSLNAGIRNVMGQRLPGSRELKAYFEEIKPRAKFAGKGVVLPTTGGLTVPIETVNLRAVIVEASQIYAQNIPQFLQVNPLKGARELQRVGRPIWKKTMRLGWSPDMKDRWVRHGLDLTSLIENHPGGMFRISLSFRYRHIVFDCPDSAAFPAARQASAENLDEEAESSYWDNYEAYGGYQNWSEYYRNRKNPCHPAYYRPYGNHSIIASRNVLISDIGLIAKRGSNDELFVAATDIRTARPLVGARLQVLDYQQKLIVEGRTDADGVAVVRSKRKPFLLVAESGEQTGYLKLDDGSANSVSHFDVAGATIKKGLKGFIYGERGVWRPGDPIFLTFMLLDEDRRLPDNHPVRFEFHNPRGQLVQTMVRKHALNGFYSFHTRTEPDAPTGNWRARIRVGGVSFEKTIKVETVMPNRLKINLHFGDEVRSLTGGKVRGELSARWLHGAIAKNLKSDVELNFRTRKTSFPKFESYIFDDPAREYEPESLTVFEGNLDESGKAAISANVRAENVSPGMLTAHFTTRVFEPGGAFSIDRHSIAYHPYQRYVGVMTPKGDKARGMLLTDTDHTVQVVMIDPAGNPVKSGKVAVELYKIKWRWWWEKGEESLADYIGRSSFGIIQKDTVAIDNGKGQWQFRIKYPAWGRYLIRVRDLNGNHITGKIVYIDWPGWAGRAQKDTPGGATVLSFSAAKSEYRVGETVALTIPTGRKGRGLVSIESGSKILKTAWIEGGSQPTRFEFQAAAEMAPSAYVHVTFLQPHLQAGNDLPIRMYGVIPIKIVDADSRLNPSIQTPEVFVPEETASVRIGEADGKPMTYTLAIVDEGLLDLTRFATPDPWGHFYKREALGVKTWDLFDDVAGAYGGLLEQLLAIGGDGTAVDAAGEKKAERFPPMVRFLGPFELAANRKNTHAVDIPRYVGSVRVMVVAGQGRAFGSAEKAVFVRKPLMVLGTLPRVLGPEESVDLPVSVFALEDRVKDVAVTVNTAGPLFVSGDGSKRITFTEVGDRLVAFRLKTGSRTGIGFVSIRAAGGGEKATHLIELDIRRPGGPVIDVIQGEIPAGETWRKDIQFTGSPGTNKVTVEASRIPPINLGQRLGYLVRYPHGCVEQLTSAVFPQLYLDKLIELPPKKQDEIQRNVQAGIARLQTFQTAGGGFAYWPGARATQPWVTNYTGHFLVEARKAGYLVPSSLIGLWTHHQRKAARSWVTGPRRAELIQAYRLYTLALAGSPEMGAMNRLREELDLPVAARWRLAAAYQLAGQPEAAAQLVRGIDTNIDEYTELSNTYGSDLRDRAMILETLGLMNRHEEAGQLLEQISAALGGNRWLSTQTTAYALIAIARLAGLAGTAGNTSFICTFHDGEKIEVSSPAPLVQHELTGLEAATAGTLTIENTSGAVLYPRIIIEGDPPPGREKAASNGLGLTLKYFDLEDNHVDPRRLEQGTDLVVEVTVRNTGSRGTYEEVALSHLLPSGWEIHNERLNATDDSGRTESEYEYRDVRDDRVYTYFDLEQDKKVTYRVLVNASYRGKFYLPMVMVEAMYDATINARTNGRWVEVVLPGQGKQSAQLTPESEADGDAPEDEFPAIIQDVPM